MGLRMRIITTSWRSRSCSNTACGVAPSRAEKALGHSTITKGEGDGETKHEGGIQGMPASRRACCSRSTAARELGVPNASRKWVSAAASTSSSRKMMICAMAAGELTCGAAAGCAPWNWANAAAAQRKPKGSTRNSSSEGPSKETSRSRGRGSVHAEAYGFGPEGDGR